MAELKRQKTREEILKEFNDSVGSFRQYADMIVASSAFHLALKTNRREEAKLRYEAMSEDQKKLFRDGVMTCAEWLKDAW